MKLVSLNGTDLVSRAFKSSNDFFQISVSLLIPFSLKNGELSLDERNTPLDLFEKVRADYGIDCSIDIGFPKPTAEFLALASCYSAYPQPGPVYVSISVGDRRKDLAVFGDRTFTNFGSIGAPEKFSKIALIPSTAFQSNSLEALVPNVEYPNALFVNSGDSPDPAGYWPRPLNTSERLSELGNFDNSWLLNRWPHLPIDTSQEYFYSAPIDQRLNSYIIGGEDVQIVNLNKDNPTIQCNVPSVNPVICIERLEKGGGHSFVQLVPNIDTLWLLPDVMTGVLVARATTICQGSSARDIAAVYGSVETQYEPRANLETHYQKFLELSGRAPSPQDFEVPLAQATPSDAFGEATLMAEETFEVPAAAVSEQQALNPAQQDVLNTLNQDRAELEALSAQAQSLFPAGVSEESMRAFMNQYASAPMSDEEAMVAIKKVSSDFASYIQSTGMDKSKLMEILKSNPNTADLAQQAAGLPDDLTHVFAELEDSFSKLLVLDEELKKLAMKPKDEPHLDLEQDTPTPPPLSIYTREWVVAQHSAGKSMAGVELVGLDLSGLNLSESDFTRAKLTDCNFENTLFADARLSQVTATGCTFIATDFERANLKAASMSGCDFTQSNLARANLEQAYMTEANLSQAKLDGSNLKKAQFYAANLTAVSAPGVVADEADFSEAKLISANLAGSRVKLANFFGADLSDVILSGAYCQRADFSDAKLTQAQVNGAILSDSQASAKTKFERTNFHKTDLGGVSWMGVQLDGAVLNGCKLDKADFADASLINCQLINVTAQGAVFDNAVIEHSDLSGINLLEGSMRGAIVRDTKMELGNYYAVDFQDTVLERSSMEGSDIGRTILAIRQALA